MQDHLAARLRPPRLDEAEMPRRDRRSQRQLELAEIAALPPLTKQRAYRRCTLGECHTETLTTTSLARDRLLTRQVIDVHTRRRHDQRLTEVDAQHQREVKKRRRQLERRAHGSSGSSFRSDGER